MEPSFWHMYVHTWTHIHGHRHISDSFNYYSWQVRVASESRRTLLFYLGGFVWFNLFQNLNAEFLVEQTFLNTNCVFKTLEHI